MNSQSCPSSRPGLGESNCSEYALRQITWLLQQLRQSAGFQPLGRTDTHADIQVLPMVLVDLVGQHASTRS